MSSTGTPLSSHRIHPTLPLVGTQRQLLDEADCLQSMRLFAEVSLQVNPHTHKLNCHVSNSLSQCRTAIVIIGDIDGVGSGTVGEVEERDALPASLRQLNILLNSSFVSDVKDLYTIAGDYDFNELRANGIRTFLLITRRCLTSILVLLRDLNARSLISWCVSIDVTGVSIWCIYLRRIHQCQVR